MAETRHYFYQGSPSAIDPEKGSFYTGVRIPAGQIAATTNPQTANILQEVDEKLRSGVKAVEIEMLRPDIFEAVPEQALKETRELAKAVGAEISVHGPLIEASGLTQQGFSEANREAAERQIELAIERSHKLSPNGNVPVTFHSSAMLPGPEVVKTKDGEKVTGVLVIEKDNGKIAGKIPIREKHFPSENPEVGVEAEINQLNERAWEQNLSHLSFGLQRAYSILNEYKLLAKQKELEEKAGKTLAPKEEEAYAMLEAGKNILNSTYMELKEIYETAYRNSSPEEKKILSEFAKEAEKKVHIIKEKGDNSEEAFRAKEEIIKKGQSILRKVTPRIYEPLDKFALEKSAETFADAAFHGYNKFKNNAPIVSIENPPAGMFAFSRAEDIKEMVEKSRRHFVERAVKEGYSKKEAEKAAEKLIGATWDVGHINMIRKQGFKEKDVVKETEIIAPYLKRIHLSDNFGIEHTELPMGWGNVPFKDMMKKIRSKAKDAEKIGMVGEAGSWFSALGQKSYPFTQQLEAMGSPVYPMETQYWNQSPGLTQGYFSGQGRILPQINYQTFGTGFSGLPAELGGEQQPSERGRMAA